MLPMEKAEEEGKSLRLYFYPDQTGSGHLISDRIVAREKVGLKGGAGLV